MSIKIKVVKVSFGAVPFFQGMGTVVDLFGFGARQKMRVRKEEISGLEADYLALSEDMNRVGGYYQAACNQTRTQLRTDKAKEEKQTSPVL